MSVDYNAVCDTCRVKIHAGQHMAGAASFGYGSRDDSGRRLVASFVFAHAWHGVGVRIEVADVAKTRPSDSYELIDLDERAESTSEPFQPRDGVFERAVFDQPRGTGARCEDDP